MKNAPWQGDNGVITEGVSRDKNNDGVADQPSDLDLRWHDAVDAHEQWLKRGHPTRPSGMWGLTAKVEDNRSVDGSE